MGHSGNAWKSLKSQTGLKILHIQIGLIFDRMCPKDFNAWRPQRGSGLALTCRDTWPVGDVPLVSSVLLVDLLSCGVWKVAPMDWNLLAYLIVWWSGEAWRPLKLFITPHVTLSIFCSVAGHIIQLWVPLPSGSAAAMGVLRCLKQCLVRFKSLVKNICNT